MGSTNYILIPFRFIVTLGHLTALLMVTHTIDDNIAASGTSNTADAKQYVYVWTVAGFVCFAFDFIGMLGGFSLFFPRINLFQICVHFIGSIYTCWFISYSWHYETIWYIVSFTNVTTAAVEILMLLAIFGFKIVVY